jgi:hypothetical protein
VPHYCSSLDDACRFIDKKPEDATSSLVGTRPNVSEVSNMWGTRYAYITGKLGACGITIGTTSGLTAQTLVAGVEARFTSADYVIAAAARGSREVAPQGLFLLSEASAMLANFCQHPSVLSALSATVNTGFRMTASGAFTDDPATLSSIGADEDVTFTREIVW